MTAPSLPGFAYRRDGVVAYRHPLVWQARRLSLDALTGQVGVFTRTSTKAVADSFGVNRTVNHSQPAWYANGGVAALDLGAAESLELPCDLKPGACSGLLDFIENGTLAGLDHLFSFGNTHPTANTPLFVIYSPAGTAYQATHNSGAGVRDSLLSTGPTSGQRVRLRWWLYSDGKVQLWQSIDGAAETAASASTALTFGANWSSPAKYWFNAYNNNFGAVRLIGAVVMLGNQTQAKLLEALA